EKHLFGIDMPTEAVLLCDAMLHDSTTDPELASRSVRFIFERTGSATHAEDRLYHVDTLRIHVYDGKRRYDLRRSHPKYMAYVNRPGTLIIHGRMDPKLTHSEADAQAEKFWIDQDGRTHTKEGAPTPVVSQLLPGLIYKVATGDLRHCPPPHEVGMLIT